MPSKSTAAGDARKADCAAFRQGFGDVAIPGPGSGLHGGELNQAITSALVGIHNKYLGRGPKRASTFYHDNVVVTLMHGVLTHAENILTETSHAETVNQIRHLFQETMEAEFLEAVERFTGREVVAFVSGNNADSDVAAEVFVLDGPPEPASRA